MKNIIIIMMCFALNLSCKAQTIVPLSTLTDEIQNNFYLKDTDNELDFFVGTYQANFQGNTCTLFITKIIKLPINGFTANYFQDVLSMRYIIKNSNEVVIEDTQNMSFTPNQDDFTIYSIRNFDSNKMVFFFYGGIGCNIGNGLITLKYLGGNQYSFKYRGAEYETPVNCPNISEYDVKIPLVKDDILFTKQ